MKCAYVTKLLEQDGVPFGIELSWGARTEHERGIDELLRALSPRRHLDGQMIACTRRLPERLFFARGEIDGEDQAVLELESDFVRRAPPPTVGALRKRIDTFERMWSTLKDEQEFSKRPVRGAWDQSTFIVHVRGTRNADALELLAAAFAAEDLSVTYGAAPSEQWVDSRGLNAPARRTPCLGLFAPGLCPPAWRHLLAKMTDAPAQRPTH
ncbi:MAG TPA: hypothetical protein VFP68_11650 [Burkholderiaceae bacterium]|nr:hypothetical protein [Burkholderiaceae bacterium]